MTRSEIILIAITIVGLVYWLHNNKPKKKINNTFKVIETKQERQQAYFEACWDEVERKKRSSDTNENQNKPAKIVKMKKKERSYTLPIIIILILINMYLCGIFG